MTRRPSPIDQPMKVTRARDTARKQSDPIVDTLIEQIASGDIAIGGHLPTEVELGDTFGISRTVVREALQKLGSLGLIETRRRVGARVRPVSEWDRLDPLVLNAVLTHGLDADLYEPLVEARSLIEPEVAALAAVRATASQVAAIETAYYVLEQADAMSSQDRIKADIAFHRAIVAACGNWVLKRFGILFEAAIMARMDLATKSPKADPPFALKKHRRIVDAIKARNPGEARRAALSVLALSKTTYADYFDGDDGGSGRTKNG